MGCPAILWQRIGGKAWRWSLTENRKPAPSGHSGIREQSFRSGNIRGHPSGTSAFLESAAETSHLRKKKLVQEYARKERGKPEDTAAMEDFREEIKEKTKRSSFAKNRRRRDVYPLGMRRAAWCVVQAWGFPKRQFQRRQAPPLFTFMGKPTKPSRKTLPWRGHTGRRLMAESALRYAMHRTKPWTAQEKCPPAGSRFHGNGEKPAFV